jgi:hypothetical protein
MKIGLKLALFVLMILINHVLYAQNQFRIEIQGGPSLNSNALNGGLFSNWGNGLIVGGGIAYHVFPSFDLVMNVSYQGYPYQGDNLQLVAPAVLGFRQKVTGKESNIFEASLAIRTSPTNSIIFPYFSLRTGVFRVNVGEIIVSSWFESSPENISRGTYHGTGTFDTKLFAALGLGFGVRLNSRFRAMVESRITQTFDLEQTFVPILLTLQLDFKK